MYALQKLSLFRKLSLYFFWKLNYAFLSKWIDHGGNAMFVSKRSCLLILYGLLRLVWLVDFTDLLKWMRYYRLESMRFVGHVGTVYYILRNNATKREIEVHRPDVRRQ